jgi:hypothetical protein
MRGRHRRERARKAGSSGREHIGLAAKLVDKKLAWDERGITVRPDFKLADEGVSRHIEIKHLICACTAMPRQDFEWIFEYKKLKPESTFTLLSCMKPTSSLARFSNTTI